MKLLIKDNEVVCDIREANDMFWRMSNYKYFNDSEGNIRTVKIAPVDHVYDSESPVDVWMVNRDRYRLKLLLDLARIYGVTVEPEVEEHLQHLTTERQRLFDERKARQEARKKREYWEAKKSLGCGSCEKLAHVGDASYFCTALGEALPCRNKPKVDPITGAVPLLDYKPFPAEKCPYRA